MPSTSQKQHDFMVLACRDPKFAEKNGISQEVACEFVEADQREGLWQADSAIRSEKDIHSLLDTSSEVVQKNAVIVSNKETVTPYMLHISAVKNPKYIPRIGVRQGSREDRTMPRVTVSTCISGCVIGYATLLYDFLDQNTLDNKGQLSDWKGGFYIHKLPFEYCLKPNSKLVYDVSRSNEHWLVTYDAGTREFPSELIGKLVYDRVTLHPTKNGYDYELSFFFEIKEPVSLDDVKIYQPGYYYGTFFIKDKTTFKNAATVFEEITRGEYLERKREVAAMLSAESKAIYHKW